LPLSRPGLKHKDPSAQVLTRAICSGQEARAAIIAAPDDVLRDAGQIQPMGNEAWPQSL
jgi:hypothetical protein